MSKKSKRIAMIVVGVVIALLLSRNTSDGSPGRPRYSRLGFSDALRFANRMITEGTATRRRMNRTEWIALVVVIVLTILGYYFDVLGPPDAGGYVVSEGLRTG